MPKSEIPSSKASFYRSPVHCVKHSNYFAIYDDLLKKYANTSFTFVEVGILDGGSLFMWRDFFGPRARIIGIDLNPEAKKWERDGFEIFIGSQTDPRFWEDFFLKVGSVDVLLDDGGHMNDQQTTTVLSCLPHISDGGLLIVEDTCTSYTKFENFSKFSFINFMKKEVDSLQSRFPGLESLKGRLSPYVYSITFYESVCVMSVDRSKCTMNAREVNNGVHQNAQDYRYIDGKPFLALLRKIYSGISIDYLSVERANKHPRFASLLQKQQIRILVRVIVVPIRAIVYFLIKLENALSYRKILRSS